MDRQDSRWMDGWMKGWTDGGWMNGWTDERTVDGWMIGWTDRWKEQVNGWMVECVEGQTDGCLDRWMNGRQSDPWVDQRSDSV